MAFNYPVFRRDEYVEDYHGIQIPDPYRWLEDPDSEETKAFVEAQNGITKPYLEKYTHKQTVTNRLTEMWNFPKYGCPFKCGPRYFYYYNTGLQNQSVIYMQNSLSDEAKVFFDPNTLSEDGTVSIRTKEFTKDGSLFSVALSTSGSDWTTVKFIDVATGEYLPDVLTKVKFSCLTWTRDNKGIFYNKYPEAQESHKGTETDQNLHQKLYYHRLGTDQLDDVICAEFPDFPKWTSGVDISECGRYLVLSIRETCLPVNRLYFCDLQQLSDGINGTLPFVKVVDNFEAEYEYITSEGSIFTFKTNLHASKYRLITIDFENPAPESWKTLVPEMEDVLQYAVCVGHDKLVLIYMHDVKNVIYVHDLATGNRLGEIPLDVGTVSSLSGQKDDAEMFFCFSSFLTPGTIFSCDMVNNPFSPVIFKEVKLTGFDQSLYETNQIFYPSKDGTMIPMFLVHKKGLKRDKASPIWLYGYGGFNISLTPYFGVSRLLFIHHFGGIFALPNIRGGGEYGEHWHKSGMLGCKQNCFDDFMEAAQYLIKEGYTKPELIAIHGGSNGGLLVGACTNQRPDLFGVAIADVGVMDMLRFHKFTIGHAWTSDYGCSDKSEEFNWLIKYSPLHNVTVPIVGQYPALLLVTADHDDRVVPLHSLKYIAQVQHVLGRVPKQTNPLLIRVETKAGHGAGKPTSKVIEEAADKITFIALSMGLEWKD